MTVKRLMTSRIYSDGILILFLFVYFLIRFYYLFYYLFCFIYLFIYLFYFFYIQLAQIISIEIKAWILDNKAQDADRLRNGRFVRGRIARLQTICPSDGRFGIQTNRPADFYRYISTGNSRIVFFVSQLVVVQCNKNPRDTTERRERQQYSESYNKLTIRSKFHCFFCLFYFYCSIIL